MRRRSHRQGSAPLDQPRRPCALGLHRAGGGGGGPRVPAAGQDRFWDYHTSERANQFYPDGASQPAYSAGNTASACLDTKPLPSSAPVSPGGYSRNSVNCDPAPLDLPSQTPRTQRKDGFVAACQGKARTPTTYDVADIPAKVSQVLKTEEVMRQFDGIREEEQHNRSTFIKANWPYNRGKNRCMNVKAIDSSRVKLSGGSNPGDDCIDANLVDGWRRPGAYVATQGPVPERRVGGQRRRWRRRQSSWRCGSWGLAARG